MLPVSPPEFLHQLASYLDQQREEITQSWMDAARGNPDIQGAERLAADELRDHLPRIFDDFLTTLRSNGSPSAREESQVDAKTHGHYRWQQNYRLDEVLRELNIVRRMMLRHGVNKFMRQNPEFGERDIDVAHDLIERFFEDVAIGSVEQYVHKQHEAGVETTRALAASNTELAQVDASRLLLMRTVSHELRNILNGLSSALAVLSVEDVESERQRMYMICRRNFADMNSLLEELMDYSALLSGRTRREIAPFEAAQLLEDLSFNYRSRAEARDMTFEARGDAALGVIVSDRRKIKQVLTNLITNAIKYRKRDGSPGRIQMTFAPLGEAHWKIAIEDDGIGIAAEDLEKIFEEFRRVGANTRQVKGMGLGLAITRRLVELLEGDIRVYSELGKGTRFELTLPLAIEEPREVASAATVAG